MIKAYKKKRVKEKTPPKGIKTRKVSLQEQVLDDINSAVVDRYLKNHRKEL